MYNEIKGTNVNRKAINVNKKVFFINIYGFSINICALCINICAFYFKNKLENFKIGLKVCKKFRVNAKVMNFLLCDDTSFSLGRGNKFRFTAKNTPKQPSVNNYLPPQ